MKYLLLVVYLFSTASFAGHCSGASHDRDHDDAKHSEMKEESSNTDSDTEDKEATESSDENDSEA